MPQGGVRGMSKKEEKQEKKEIAALGDAELAHLAWRGTVAQGVLDEREQAERHKRYLALPMQDRLRRAILTSGAVRMAKDEHDRMGYDYRGYTFRNIADVPLPRPIEEYTSVIEAVDDFFEALDARDAVAS